MPTRVGQISLLITPHFHQKHDKERSMKIAWVLASIAVLCLAASSGAMAGTNPAGSDNYPIWLRLRFDKDSSDPGYLWERRVLPEDTSWAERSYDRVNWDLVPDLPRNVKVGLALGGGVVRGIGHIGVLRVLEQNNVPIHGIAGTSMGAIIGGLYASGISVDDLESIVKDSVDWKNIFTDRPPKEDLPLWERLLEKPREPGLDLSITWKRWGFLLYPSAIEPDFGAGLRTAQKFTDEIAKRTLEADYRAGFKFDSLPIPFGTMLTNMNTANSELMREGTICTALRGSASFPMAFEPMRIAGNVYIDGGVLNNLPVDAFIRFDGTRAPDNMMNVAENETTDYYVIAVYPSKRRGTRHAVKQKPELSGPLGIAVMNAAFPLAREKHVWNSWDAAHSRIDLDVEGGFDFHPKKLNELIHAGSAATDSLIESIKLGVASMEDHMRSSQNLLNLPPPNERILRLSEAPKLTGPGETEERKIRDAIRFEKGSWIEKTDVCEALKRIHSLGRFEEVGAEMRNAGEEWSLTFRLVEKESSQDSVKPVLKMGFASTAYDSIAKRATEEAIRRRINKEKRALNFEEVKDTVERCLVRQGFVSPRVDSVQFLPSDKSHNTGLLHIHGEKGTFLRNIRISCDGAGTKMAVANQFRRPFSPNKILKKAGDVRKEFQLKTISVEGHEGDCLNIAVQKKSNATLELPSLALETHEGLNFFGEIRIRRWIFDWSPYANYTQNFPLKMSRQLPRGQGFNIGLQRYRSIMRTPYSFSSFIPQLSAHYKGLDFPSALDETAYEQRTDEFSSSFTFPLYRGRVAAIPGLEATWINMGEEKKWYFNGVLALRHDDLDRTIFPNSGLKADIEAKGGKDNESWWGKARAKAMWAPLRFQMWSKPTTVAIQLFGSWYDENAPHHERYSLGGFSPRGAYQLRLLDSEDLPGYGRNEFIERLMWKAGTSARVALFEISPVGLRLSAHVEASAFFADIVPDPSFDFESLSSDKARFCGALGLYLDTTLLNIGLAFLGNSEHIDRDAFFRKNFHLSVVYYGLAF
ncbi:hypothetical protein E3J62_12575 [candidate division TA06 bacterium]|uniref:PNPLA domain-containing protein n=1 Tax=candidate division TA06 bacterium TaxID=2250710 RepID=A0A523UMF8_UNCT6|nr:MAG: hypothetical protein E3J62_12575 [candidate division TA06 bacterium]